MIWLVGILLLSYTIVVLFSFLFLYRSRKLIGYHLGMNIAMSTSGIIGLAVGALLGSMLFHHNDAYIIILTTLIAIGVGVLFGSLVDYQTLLTGVASGTMAGLMGPMLGFHSHQPILLVLFCSFLVYLSFGLVCYSVRA